MAKPLHQLKRHFPFPITMPTFKVTKPCGCCKSEIHPVNEAHGEQYGILYCDRICFIQATGAEFVGDGVDRVRDDGKIYSIIHFIKEREYREYG